MSAELEAVVGPLRSTLRSRAVVDDVDASSACEPNACWSNAAGATGPGPDGSWIGRAGMSMCRRLMAGLNRSSLRSIGLSVTLTYRNTVAQLNTIHGTTPTTKLRIHAVYISPANDTF